MAGKQKISRRRFLAGTTIAGVALGMPGWLAGCGSTDDGGSAGGPTPTPSPTPVARPRERRTLHFDFSFAPVRNLRLIAVNSASHRRRIVAHTAATRTQARRDDPQLAAVPDARLTHYIADVDLPSDALQLLMATGVTAAGEDAVASLYVHVPNATAPPSAPRTPSGTGFDNLVIGIRGFVTVWDTAVSLLFHAPEIMNLNLAQGSEILDMIGSLPPCGSNDPNCEPLIATLATLVGEKWPATTSGGWATLVQVIAPDGKPVTDSAGNPAYRYDLDADVEAATTTVAADIRAAIFDAAQFQGTNWHPTEGLTVSDGTTPSAGAPAGADNFSVVAQYPRGSHPHGVKFVNAAVTDAGSRTVQLQFRNDYIRYLSAYVQFANTAGDLPVQNPTSDDTSRAKFLAWINSNFTILGIPRFGDDVPLTTVQFDVPADASIAKVYFGGLGTGGQAFCPEAVDGSLLTLIFNLGIPTLLLVAGVAVTADMLTELSKEFDSSVIQVLKASLPLILAQTGGDLANGIFGSVNSKSAKEALIELGNAVLSAFFATGQVAALIFQLLALVVTSNIIAISGPLGVVFRLIAVAADVATIGETVGEVLANPALFINQLTLTQTTTVTVNHDPDDFQFPATARNYEVTLIYDSVSSVEHKITGTIEQGRATPIPVAFAGMPAGGNVTVDVYLTSASGCLVGRSVGADGTPGPFGPVPGDQTDIAVTIKEFLIPLTDGTQYVHDLKLEYQDGEHVWAATPAPTATITSLMEGQDDALNDLTGLTLAQRVGVVGYGYLAGGQGVPFCGQSAGGIMHMIQNLSLTSDPGPDSALKQLSCGLQQTIGVAYEKLGAAGGQRNFFLQPTEQGFYLQSAGLSDSQPFNLDNPLTWGVFSQALDSLAVVATGHVIGVDRQNHKMQILTLPAAPSNPNTAPQAVPFSVSKMGLGTRPGLLKAPVAVTVLGATIFILEDGNQRVQAVDVSGNPVPRFQNGTTNIIQLEQGDGIVYLDLGVEGMGYLYVLSFVNDGSAAADYRLDVYTPQGDFLTRTTGVAAARMAVDTFRNVYTLNYETVAGAPRVEPSLSQWNPSTPGGCPTPTAG